MKIYVIRHGLTASNKLGVMNGGRNDEPLDPDGFAEVEAAAKNLPAGLVKIYASSMLRTRQTADILNTKNLLPISYHLELKEVDFGNFTGRSWDDVITEYGPELQQSYWEQRYDFTPYDGEKVETVHNRVKKILAEIKVAHPDGNILIVSHGGILRAMHYIYYGTRMERAANASLHEFEI